MNYIDYIQDMQREVSLGWVRKILAKGGYRLVIEYDNSKGIYNFKVINSSGQTKGLYHSLEDVAKRIKPIKKQASK